MSNKRDYDSTVARIAGNLLSNEVWIDQRGKHRDDLALVAVEMARAIVQATKNTEPKLEHQS